MVLDFGDDRLIGVKSWMVQWKLGCGRVLSRFVGSRGGFEWNVIDVVGRCKWHQIYRNKRKIVMCGRRRWQFVTSKNAHATVCIAWCL